MFASPYESSSLPSAGLRRCGRLQVEEGVAGTLIRVPFLRMWYMAIIFFPFILAWVVSLLVLPFVLLQPQVFSPSAVTWFAAWTLAGLFVVRLFVWNLFGKKTVRLQHGQMLLKKRGDLFYRAKTYELQQMQNLRIVNYDVETNGYYWRLNYLFTRRTQSVEFDYAGKRVRAMDELTPEEAQCLFEVLAGKGIHSQGHQA